MNKYPLGHNRQAQKWFKELALQGWSNQELAKYFDCSVTTISNWSKRLGVTLRQKVGYHFKCDRHPAYLSKEDILKLRRKGKTYREIASMCKVSRQSIWNWEHE